MKRIMSIFLMAAVWLGVGAAPVLAWSGKLGWIYDARYPVLSSIAVAEGLVVAGDNVGNLHAVHAASWQAAWVYNGSNSIVGQPVISDKRVIFAQADGTITTLSLSDGSVLWRHAPPAEGSAADTVMDGAAVGDGKVFFVKGDGKMVALDASNGKALWTYDSGQELRNAPLFANGIVFL